MAKITWPVPHANCTQSHALKCTIATNHFIHCVVAAVLMLLLFVSDASTNAFTEASGSAITTDSTAATSGNSSQCPHGRDPFTNCTQCFTGRDPSTDCMACLVGYQQNDRATECAAIPGKNIE